MKKLSTLRFISFVAILSLSTGIMAQTNPTARAVPFTEDFGTTTFTSAPSGFGAWNGLSGASINTQALAEGSTPSGNATIATATAATITGGVFGLDLSSNGKFYVQTSSNATNGVNQMVMALNATGYSDVELSYDVEIISAQPRTVGIVAQYRVGTSGSWTTISAGTGDNPYSQAGGTTGLKTTVTATLPSECDNEAMVQVRWAIWRAGSTGNSSGIAIDNVEVDGTPLAASTSVQFASTGSTVNEDAGTVGLILEITNEDATPTSVDVVLTTSNAGRVDNYITETVIFGAASGADELVTITITDNSLCDGNTVIGFELQNISGGNSATIGANDTYDLTINDNDVCTSVSFDVTSASVSEGVGTYNVAVTIADFSTSVDTDVDVVLVSGDGTRISGFTSAAVNFPANSGATQNVTLTVVENSLCDGDEELTFELQNLSGGQGTPFIGPNDSRTLTITDNDAAVAPVAQAASGVGEEQFTANWDAVSGASGYELDVYTIVGVEEDFTDGDFTADPVWSGSTGNYAVLNANPSGAATTDGFFLASNASVGNSALYTASEQVREWKFSWASTSFSPATGNHFGVVLMADAPFTAITDAFNGYYLRIGVDGGTDLVELWRSTGAGKTKVGDFTTPNYGSTALTNGINVRVTRSLSGEFQFFYGTGFTYATTPVTDGGVLTDATHSTSSYFGVYTAFSSPAATRRVYMDNVDLRGVEYVLEGELVGNVIEYDVLALAPGTTYYYVVRAEVGGGCGLSANSNEIEVTTDAAIVPELSSTESALDFGFVLENATSATQSFDVSGVDLDPAAGDVNVSVGLGLEYEISLDEVAWSTDLDLPYTGGVLAATTVFVRFAPTTSVLQSGNITISGGNADDVDVSISGSGSDARIYWNFDSADPTIDVIPDISTSAISRANTNTSPDLTEVAVQSTGYTGASGGANATTTVVGGAFNATTSGYFQWSHVPASGTAVVVTDISFGTRRSTSGPTAYSIRSSADGYSSNVATGTITPNTTWVLREHNGLNVVGALDQPLTFRIYGHDGSAANNTGAANWRIDDLDILGEAIEPATAYYSRSNGNVNDAIWATTPTGDPGPAIWSPSASMIVQEGDTITVNANTNVDDLTLESNSRLIVTTERLLSVYGNTIELANNSVSASAGEVEFLSFDPVTITINGLVTFNNLTVATFAGTTVTGTLDIRGTLLLADGDFDATNANVRLRSNAVRTGHLGPVGPTADYIGNLTTQRFIPGGVTNWRLLGSPVAGRTVADWNDDFITAGFPGSNYPNFDQPVGSGVLWPSVRWYDETNEGEDLMDGLVGVASIAQELTPGQGFAVWSGDALGGTASFVVDVTGEPTIARTPLSLPVTFTSTSTPTADGWNLVSNPLPSAVAFASISRGSDLFDGYYIYDPVSGNTANWDADLGISVPSGVLNGVIQSSQAFWLKASGSNVATSVQESNKVSANTGGVFGGVADGTPNVPLIRLTMAGSTGTWSDQAVVAFAAGTPALDVKDAMKLDFAHASAPRIATRTTDGYDLIVNRYGTSTGNINIPVTVRAPITGTYSITVAISGTDALTCYTLEDLLTGTVTPVTDGSVYTFSMDATATIVADRFVLRSSTALPYSASAALCGGTATGQVAVQVPEGPVDLTLMDAFGNAVQVANNVPVGEFIFTDLLAGNYSVSVGNSSACGTVSAPVVVMEPFALEAGMNTVESTCGTEADGRLEVSILGGEAPYSYLWSNGSTEEGITGVAGAYTALVTDASGCTLSVEAAIPAGPGPEALFETSVEPVLINQPVFFTNLSSPDATYFWDLGDGTSSSDFDVTHSYELPGVYTVVLTVNDGNCASSYTQEISVQLTTSTSVDVAAPFVLNAWSAGDQLIVEHGFDHGKPVQIDVLDATGRLHMQRQVVGTPARVSIPASALNTGIWFVRITSGQVQQSFRVPVVR